MIEDILKNIALNEKGSFYTEDFTLVGINGVRAPASNYIIELSINDCLCVFNMNVGINNLVIATCELPKYISPIPFDVKSVTHFENLLFRNKSRLRVKSTNKNLKYFIENKALLCFEEVLKKYNFCPVITLIKDKGINTIRFTFSNEFPYWFEILPLIITFLK